MTQCPDGEVSKNNTCQRCLNYYKDYTDNYYIEHNIECELCPVGATSNIENNENSCDCRPKGAYKWDSSNNTCITCVNSALGQYYYSTGQGCQECSNPSTTILNFYTNSCVSCNTNEIVLYEDGKSTNTCICPDTHVKLFNGTCAEKPEYHESCENSVCICKNNLEYDFENNLCICKGTSLVLNGTEPLCVTCPENISSYNSSTLTCDCAGADISYNVDINKCLCDVNTKVYYFVNGTTATPECRDCTANSTPSPTTTYPETCMGQANYIFNYNTFDESECSLGEISNNNECVSCAYFNLLQLTNYENEHDLTDDIYYNQQKSECHACPTGSVSLLTLASNKQNACDCTLGGTTPKKWVVANDFNSSSCVTCDDGWISDNTNCTECTGENDISLNNTCHTCDSFSEVANKSTNTCDCKPGMKKKGGECVFADLIAEFLDCSTGTCICQPSNLLTYNELTDKCECQNSGSIVLKNGEVNCITCPENISEYNEAERTCDCYWGREFLPYPEKCSCMDDKVFRFYNSEADSSVAYPTNLTTYPTTANLCEACPTNTHAFFNNVTNVNWCQGDGDYKFDYENFNAIQCGEGMVAQNNVCIGCNNIVDYFNGVDSANWTTNYNYFENASNQCQACPSGAPTNLSLNITNKNTCDCSQLGAYFFNFNTGTCDYCGNKNLSINNGTECENTCSGALEISLPSTNQCKTCAANEEVVSNSCKCIANYVRLSNGSCALKPNEYSTCSDESCSCTSPLVWDSSVGENKCKCPNSNETIFDNNGTPICQRCPVNESTYNESNKTCDCNWGRTYFQDDNICSCKSHEIFKWIKPLDALKDYPTDLVTYPTDTSLCIECPATTTTLGYIKNFKTCIGQNDNIFDHATGNVSTCATGFFSYENNCISCRFEFKSSFSNTNYLMSYERQYYYNSVTEVCEACPTGAITNLPDNNSCDCSVLGSKKWNSATNVCDDCPAHFVGADCSTECGDNEYSDSLYVPSGRCVSCKQNEEVVNNVCTCLENNVRLSDGLCYAQPTEYFTCSQSSGCGCLEEYEFLYWDNTPSTNFCRCPKHSEGERIIEYSSTLKCSICPSESNYNSSTKTCDCYYGREYNAVLNICKCPDSKMFDSSSLSSAISTIDESQNTNEEKTSLKTALYTNDYCKVCPSKTNPVIDDSTQETTNCLGIEDYIFKSNSFTSEQCQGFGMISKNNSCISCVYISGYKDTDNINIYEHRYRTNDFKCLECPVGSTSQLPNKNHCDCSVKGAYYFNYSSGVCIQCPAQTYSNGTNCLECPSGQISNYLTNTCSYCAIGYAKNLNSCVKCEANQTSVNSVCVDCPNNYIFDDNTSTCLSCHSAQIPNTVYDSETKTCNYCPGASIYNSNTNSCDSCVSGAIADREANTCTKCPSGHIASKTENICTQCPDNQEPSENQSVCTSCAVGYAKSVYTGLCMLTNTESPVCTELDEIVINNTCVSCYPRYKYVNPETSVESCVDNCPSGTFLVDSKVCESCSLIRPEYTPWINNCKASCDQNSEIWYYTNNSCLKCDSTISSDNRYIQDGVCVEYCDSKNYPDTWRVCEQCNIKSTLRYFDPISLTCVENCPDGYTYNAYKQICDECLEKCPYGECVDGSCIIVVDDTQVQEVSTYLIDNIQSGTLQEIKYEQLLILYTGIKQNSEIAKNFFTALSNTENDNLLEEDNIGVIDEIINISQDITDETNFDDNIKWPIAEYLFRRLEESIDTERNTDCSLSDFIDCSIENVIADGRLRFLLDIDSIYRKLNNIPDVDDGIPYRKFKFTTVKLGRESSDSTSTSTSTTETNSATNSIIAYNANENTIKSKRVVASEITDYSTTPSFENVECENELIKFTDKLLKMKVEVPTQLKSQNNTSPNITIYNENDELEVVSGDLVKYSRETYYRYLDGDTKKQLDIFKICPIRSELVASYTVDFSVIGSSEVNSFLFIQEKGVNPNNKTSEFFTESCLKLTNTTHNTDIDFATRRNLLRPNVEFYCGSGCSATKIFTSDIDMEAIDITQTTGLSSIPDIYNYKNTTLSDNTTTTTSNSTTNKFKVVCECDVLTNSTHLVIKEIEDSYEELQRFSSSIYVYKCTPEYHDGIVIYLGLLILLLGFWVLIFFLLGRIIAGLVKDYSKENCSPFRGNIAKLKELKNQVTPNFIIDNINTENDDRKDEVVPKPTSRSTLNNLNIETKTRIYQQKSIINNQDAKNYIKYLENTEKLQEKDMLKFEKYVVSNHDLLYLQPQEVIDYENRTFCELLSKNILSSNILISGFSNKSLLVLPTERIARSIIFIVLLFFLNNILYSEYIMSKVNFSNNGEGKNSFRFMIKENYLNIIVSLLVSLAAVNILTIIRIIIIPEQHKRQMNELMMGYCKKWQKDAIIINQAKTLIPSFVIYLTTLLLCCISLTYMASFASVFSESIYNVLISGVWSMILYIALWGVFIPFLITTLRLLAIKGRNNCLMKFCLLYENYNFIF